MKTKSLFFCLSLIVLLGEIIETPQAYSQTPTFRIPIIVVDSVFGATGNFRKVVRDTLQLGVHPSATYCLDNTLFTGFQDHWFYILNGKIDSQTAKEKALPPASPGFEARMFNGGKIPCTGSVSLGLGVKANIHQYVSSAQKDTFKVSYGLDASDTTMRISFEWPSVLSEYCTGLEMRFVHPDLGTTVIVDMRTRSKYVLDFSPDALQNYTIIMTGPKVPPGPPAPVTLVSPANYDSTILTNPTLQWNAVANAYYYRLQLSTDSTFGSKLFDDTLRVTSKQFSTLQQGMWYYWRVFVVNQYGVSLWQNPLFRFKTKVTEPPAPVQIFPSNEAVDIPVSSTFLWHPITSGSAVTYHAQVATDTFFTVSSLVKEATGTDTTVLVSGLQYCTYYYWRVNAVNADGTSKWTPWRFKTVLTKPAAPTLISPSDNATGISLTPTLSWSGDICTQNFHLQVAKDSLFTNLVLNTILSQTSRLLSTLEQSTYHYWRVKAINSVDSSDYSSFRKFRTLVAAPSAPPQLLSPATGDSMQNQIVSLLWRTTPYTDNYHLQIATDINFTSLIFNDSTLTDTFRITSALTNCTRYYWRVRSRNSAGASSYSTAWNFKIVPVAPTSPALASPANDATGISLTPTLSWIAGDICSYSYRLQVSKDSLFPTVVWNEYLAQTSRQLTTLEEDTYYYWRVKAINPVDSSQFAQYRRFKTLINPPVAPQLISPSNGVTDVEPAATLLWHSTARTNSYHLQIATDLNFTSLIFNDSTLTDTSKVTAPLTNCNLYYWRVRGKNFAGVSSFSSTWNFKIKPATPLQPVLVSPADNATGTTLTPTLSWSASDICSYSYHLQVAKDAIFTNIVADVYTNLTSRTLSTLELNTDYYWHVKSLNPVDSSSYTAYRKFKTFQQQPPTPTLASPAAGDTNQSPTGALIWNAALYTEFYNLQIATDQNFTPLSLVVNDSTLTDISYTPGALTNCKWYYWRVRAKNGAGTSNYSSTWSFKVRTAVPGIPNLISPYNTQDSLSEMVRLTWNKADICTQRYFYHVSHSASFTDTVTIGQTTDTTVVVGPIPGNVYFYWHVQAVNFLGSGSFSPTWQFHTTRSRPSVPVLLSPADGVTDMPSGFTFMWDSAAFASSYRIQVALDIAFNNLKVNDSTILRQPGILPSKTVSSLLNSTTYYWRVNAKNEIGISIWSTVQRFTTLFPPAAPALNIPYNGAVEVSITPQFDWSVAQRADLYRLQIAEDTEFSRMTFDDSTISILSWQITNPLKSLSKYYWRVRGKNSVGWGAWSSVNNFTTTRTGVANWLIPLTISETGPAYATIYFGVHPSATAGIDPYLGEYELPPIDQWYFDARFISPFIGEGLLVDIVKFNNYAQIDTFQFTFQPEPGLGSYPMKMSWSNTFVKSICDSMVIKDQLISPAVHARMDRDSFVTVSNTSTRSLYIVKYGTFPLPLDVKAPIAELPKGFMLYQNYPNPFNPSTNVTFSTDKTAKIQIKIYDVLGRELTTIADASFLPGQYTLQWNGRDASGDAMPSGVYYVRMIAASISDGSSENARYINTRKMIMLK